MGEVGDWRHGMKAASDELTASIPVISSAAPKPEAKTPVAGTMNQVPRADHQHPRLSSATTGTLKAGGVDTIVFTRTFDVKPAVTILQIEAADNQPVVFKVVSWTTTGTAGVDLLYTGCVIKGYRSQALPQQTQLNVLALLGAVIGGVNALLSSISSFNIFGGSAAGVEYSLIALQPST